MQIGDALVIITAASIPQLRSLVAFQRRSLAVAEAALRAAEASGAIQESAMDSVPEDELTIRQRIETYLEFHGPATSGLIATELKIGQNNVCTILGRHVDTFVKCIGKRWGLKRVEDARAEKD